MKKISVLALVFGMAFTAWGQTMKIHQKAVTVAVPASEAGKMTYGADGTTLTIMGKTYTISEIDSITVDRSIVKANTVTVDYQGNRAHVLVAGNVAPNMVVTAHAADVSVVVDASWQQEIFYTLKGQTSEGSFFMDGEYKSTVTLDNLTLNNSDGAAIDIANGKRIDVIVPHGTTTTLSDGKGLQKACFFVNGHPELSGGGTLLLTGNSRHAFASDEYTRIKPDFGMLKVLQSIGDGLHIKQYFKMQGGTIEIANTSGDCIDVEKTTNPLDADNGKVFIDNGSLKMRVTADDVKGLKCDSDMTLSGGTIEAGVIGLGTKGVSVGGNLLVQQKTAVPTKIVMAVTGTTFKPKDPVLESKCRGIKGKGNFVFDGGDIQISATGKKSKAISIDGSYTYKSGTINCPVDANK